MLHNQLASQASHGFLLVGGEPNTSAGWWGVARRRRRGRRGQTRCSCTPWRRQEAVGGGEGANLVKGVAPYV